MFKPILVLFIVQFFEIVFAQDFYHLYSASVFSTNVVSDLLNHLFWVNITFFKHNETRDTYWVDRRIIKIKLIASA